MRINPINTAYSANYSNVNRSQKISKTNQTSSNSNVAQSSAQSLKQNISFGFIEGILNQRRVKKAIGENYYKHLQNSKFFTVEYMRGFPGLVHVAHFNPEYIGSPEHEERVDEIIETFLENHSDRKFKKLNFAKGSGLVLHGASDLIMVSTLAKKLRPYETGFDSSDDWVGDHDLYE